MRQISIFTCPLLCGCVHGNFLVGPPLGASFTKFGVDAGWKFPFLILAFLGILVACKLFQLICVNRFLLLLSMPSI